MPAPPAESERAPLPSPPALGVFVFILASGRCFHLHFKIIGDSNLFFLYAICCPFGLPVLFFAQILNIFSPACHFLFLPYHCFVLLAYRLQEAVLVIGGHRFTDRGRGVTAPTLCAGGCSGDPLFVTFLLLWPHALRNHGGPSKSMREKNICLHKII